MNSSLSRQLISLLRLVRLSNSLPASALVLIGAALVDAFPPTANVWKAAAAMWCVTAFGYASNDLFDVTEDSINKPDRPLPSGIISPRTARLLVICLAVAAASISGSIGWMPLVAAVAVMALLTAYNVRLKGRPLQGNFLIGVLAGCTLFVGGVAARAISVDKLPVDTLSVLLLPSLILASFVTTREILKTVEDEAGDAVAGKQTITIRRNSQTAVRILTVSAFVALLLLALPVWLQNYSLIYLVIASVGVGGPLLYTILFLRHSQDRWRVQRCLALLKASYFAGILALWLA